MDIVGGQEATDDVGTDGSLLCSSYCGESVLQMLVQNNVILSLCGDPGTTTARAIVGGDISMLQTVNSHDVNVICIYNDLRTLSCS